MMAHLAIALMASGLGGFVICWLLVGGMRRSVGFDFPGFDPMPLYVGVTERVVATLLVVYAPSYLAAFIGGWVVLKISAGWGQRKSADETEKDKLEKGHFIALIGSVISFGIAIAAGLWVDSSALSVWRSAD